MSDKIPDTLPWKIIIAGDFTPGKTHEKLYSVDTHSFEDLMRQLAPRLHCWVPDILEGHSKNIPVDFTFRTIKDFHPCAIAQSIPSIDTIISFKHDFLRFVNGTLTYRDITISVGTLPYSAGKIVQNLLLLKFPHKPVLQHTAVKALKVLSEKSHSLDSIIKFFKPPEAGTRPQQLSEKSNSCFYLENSPERHHDGATSKENAEKVIEEIDSLISQQINASIHARAFRELEAVWRGLKCFVDHANRKKGIQIELLSCPKDHFSGVLKNISIWKSWQTPAKAPDCIVALYGFSNTDADRQIISQCALLGQSIHTLMLCQLGAAFFGVEHFGELHQKVPSLSVQLQSAGYEQWRALREKPEAEWLALVANDFCARMQYTAAQCKPEKPFIFRETDDQNPCQSGVLATASLLTLMAASIGEEVIYANSSSPEVTDMQVLCVYEDSYTERLQTCPVMLTANQVSDMIDFGIMPLNCRENSFTMYMESVTTFGAGRSTIPANNVAHLIDSNAIAFDFSG